jgi:hypothetical protein
MSLSSVRVKGFGRDGASVFTKEVERMAAALQLDRVAQSAA